MKILKKIIFCSLVLVVFFMSAPLFRNNNTVVAKAPLKYQVVLSKTNTFEKKIESLLQKGWELQGGMSISIASSGLGAVWYAQALVKRQ